MPWATVDAGATVLSAQGYRLSATVGQPDALTVPMTGGPWLLRGGFWLTPAEGADRIFTDGFQ
ncbi:MAG: hypothetical protein KF823_03210 [Xanthomonadales bacterium]|nr:hypothetical protein [Xanthomonadales bacterium]